MKTISSLLLGFCFFVCTSQSNQTLVQKNKDYSSLRFLIQGGFGFGKVKNETEPNYNMNLEYFEALVNYKFSSQYGVAIGIGINEFSGNGYNSNGNFYHEREDFRIPLLFTADYEFSDKIKAVVGLGFYGKTVRSDEYRFLDTLESDIYEDWSFGFQGNFGIIFQFKSYMAFGINLNTQSDFTDIDAQTGKVISGEQRIESINALGVIALIKF